MMCVVFLLMSMVVLFVFVLMFIGRMFRFVSLRLVVL